MLQIRLSKAPPADGPTAAATAADTVTVVCPDHLVLADLPVAKGIGAPIAASQLKAVGRRSRRQLGERVHFCVRCDFPISIYGRLSPCEHAFCLDCARSDSICYLCDERIQKIQTIKLMEGIFICAAPHCLKSFLKRSDFESHIHQSHSELLHPNYTDKEEHNNINMNMNNNNINDSEALSAKQSSAAESTLRAPPLPPAPRPNDDKNRRQLAREPSLPRPPIAALPKPLGPGPFQQPGFDLPVVVVPKNEHPGSPFTEYPAFGYGSQAYYGAPYEMGRPEEAGSDHGSLLGVFPPPGDYPPQPWGGVGPTGGDGFGSNSIVVPSPESSQGKIPFYGGEFGRSKPMEMRDGKGILAPPPPQLNRKFYSDMSRDQPGYGWQQDSRDGFGSSQD